MTEFKLGDRVVTTALMNEWQGVAGTVEGINAFYEVRVDEDDRLSDMPAVLLVNGAEIEILDPYQAEYTLLLERIDAAIGEAEDDNLKSILAHLALGFALDDSEATQKAMVALVGK